MPKVYKRFYRNSYFGVNMGNNKKELNVNISKLDFWQRSVLFAELSAIAYMDKSAATKAVKKIGFTTVEYYDIGGAQAYRFLNKTDVVIACRGTEPTQWNDIAADLRATPVPSESVSRVHKGFKREVDDLWPVVCDDLERVKKRTLWFTGHSLGAAMATIMASRCCHEPSLADPAELYTYGSPRVGWKKYCATFSCTHHRWVNNNDIVTRVPPALIGYRHDGTEHYLNAYGQYRSPGVWQRVKDRLRGLWFGIKKGKIDSFSDHLITEYIAGIKNNSK